MGFLARATNEVVSAIRMPGMRTMFTPARTELERLQRRRIFNCCTTKELKEDCVREGMSNSSCNCCARDRSRGCDGDHVLGNRVPRRMQQHPERLRSASTATCLSEHRERLGTHGALVANGNLRRGPLLQTGQDIQGRPPEDHVEHRGRRESQPILEALDQLEAEHGRALSHSHGARARDISGGLTPRMRQPMKAFLADRGGAREQQAKERAHTAAAREQRPRRRHEPYHEAR